MHDRTGNVRDAVVKSTSGKNVKDTSQLKGEAKDSIGGEKNVTKEHSTSWSPSGPYGGMNKSK